MAASYFGDKSMMPDDASLSAALRNTRPLWDELIRLSGGCGEWKFYSKTAGWSYPVKQGKRTLFYMMPKEGFVQIVFVLGERAVEAAIMTDLPAKILDEIINARTYVEGRSLCVQLCEAADMETIRILLQIKQAN